MSYSREREAFIARICREVSDAPRYYVAPHPTLKDGRVYIHDRVTDKSAGPDTSGLTPADADSIARAMNSSEDAQCQRMPWRRRIELARAILRDAATHHRLCEQDCNEGLTAAQERRSEACERRITARLAELGPGFAVAEFSGDPRGATVKIRVPSGYGDSWGDRTMLCVPVRG